MKAMEKQRTLRLIRKNPAVIIKSFLALQLAGLALFFLVGILFHFSKIYRSLPLAIDLVSFQAAQIIVVFGAETLLIFYIFFAWHKEYLEIKKDYLVHRRGIIFRQKTSFPLADLHDLSYRQGPLGRLVKYGTLEWKEGHSLIVNKFSYLPEPQETVNFILRLKNSHGLQANYPPANKLVTFPKIAELLSRSEDEQLEFKSSLRWDFQRQQVNKDLEKAVLKTVAAFLNSQGGHLIIGVDDRRQPLGLEPDFRSLPKANADGFANHFSNLFRQNIGAEFWSYIKTAPQIINNQTCYLISVAPSARPVFLKLNQAEEFYIRTGNNSATLSLSQAQNYIRQRFHHI